MTSSAAPREGLNVLPYTSGIKHVYLKIRVLREIAEYTSYCQDSLLIPVKEYGASYGINPYLLSQ